MGIINSKKEGFKIYVLLLLSLIIGVIIMVLVAVNLSREGTLSARVTRFLDENKSSKKNTLEVSDEASVKETFHVFFKSLKDYKASLRNLYRDDESGDVTEEVFLQDSCSQYNILYQPNETMCPRPSRYRPFVKIIHACCESTPNIISPSTMVDIYNINRTLAQFANERQYFVEESCRTIVACEICHCMILKSVVSAVYVSDENGYQLGLFPTNSCCKCVNSFVNYSRSIV